MSVGSESEDRTGPRALELRGVPETLLWNLYHRAVAARGEQYGFHDPKSIELVERIDYPFERFDGGHTEYAARWQALRVQTMDAEIRRFLDAHPDATVVALGEGLDTQFWRVDNGQVRWLTVDLPETVEARGDLLPDGPRQCTVAGAAQQERWMDEVDPGRSLLITAQGLLMYLPLPDVEALVTRCARRFPGAALVFDAVPARTVHAQEHWKPATPNHFRAPSWAWGMDATTRRRLAALPGVYELREVPPVKGRGLLFGGLVPVLRRIPGLSELLPAFPVLRTQFAPRIG